MKKNNWLFDLLAIIALSFITNYVVSYISTLNNGFVIGQMINLFAFMIILLFASYKLTDFQKNRFRDLITPLKNRLTIKHLPVVLAIFIAGKLSYSVLIEVDFIQDIELGSILFKPISLSPEQFYGNRITIILFAFVFVVMGVFAEELFFRIYLFELQYKLYGKYTWLINGLSWSIMHIFTSTNIIALLPSAFMLAYIYQKKRNFWIVFAIHILWNSTSIIGIITQYYQKL